MRGPFAVLPGPTGSFCPILFDGATQAIVLHIVRQQQLHGVGRYGQASRRTPRQPGSKAGGERKVFAPKIYTT